MNKKKFKIHKVAVLTTIVICGLLFILATSFHKLSTATEEERTIENPRVYWPITFAILFGLPTVVFLYLFYCHRKSKLIKNIPK